MSKVKIIDKLQWAFDSGKPFIQTKDSVYATRIEVDPFPAYIHDYSVVRETYDTVLKVAPIERPPNIYILAYEALSRTNGWAQTVLDDPKWDEIVFLGKRTPIHPAVSRYLVAHEYGHHVERALINVRKTTEKKLLHEYKSLRGTSHEYGGGEWHKNTKELFANDFRILITGTEKEFWPHPGFYPPTDIGMKHIQEYWGEAGVDLGWWT